MASKKISELDPAGALTGAELVEVVQGGQNVQSTTQAIANLGGGGGAWGSITGTLSSQTDLQAALDAKLAVSAFAKYIIDQATPSTAGGTITLDCNSQVQRSHVGSATFAAAKIIALSNTTNALFFNFIFEITNVAAVLTVPSDWLMADTNFDGTDWVPPLIGKYELGGAFDDTNNVWYVKIQGPFF